MAEEARRHQEEAQEVREHRRHLGFKVWLPRQDHCLHVTLGALHDQTEFLQLHQISGTKMCEGRCSYVGPVLRGVCQKHHWCVQARPMPDHSTYAVPAMGPPQVTLGLSPALCTRSRARRGL